MVISHDIEDLKKYYEYFKPSFLHFIKYGCGDIIIRKVEDFDSFYKEIITYNNEDRKFCAYACINPYKGSERKIPFITHADNLFFDIDSYNGEDIKELFEALATAGFRWEWHIKSGLGQYLFIPLPHILLDSSSRSDICNMYAAVVDFFNDKFKILDSRCKDITRISRVWGSIHFKNVLENNGEPLLCRVLARQEVSDVDCRANFEAAKKIGSQKRHHYPLFMDSTINECYACESVIKDPLPKLEKGSGFNDRFGKNLCIYCCRKYGREGLHFARESYEARSKSPSEADGWFRKAQADQDFRMNCFEIQYYLKEHYPDVFCCHCERCLREKKNRIVYTDEKLSFQELKKKFRRKFKFFISDSNRLEGSILPSEQGSVKTMLTLGWISEREEGSGREEGEYEKVLGLDDLDLPGLGDYDFTFIGEKKPDKDLIVRRVDASFYRYTFREGDAKYILLSERELELGEAIIRGMIVELSDQQKWGDGLGKVDAVMQLLFAFDYKPKTVRIRNHEELFKIINFTKREYLDNLFSFIDEGGVKKYYAQPDFVSDLILYWMHSGKIKYPLHLNIIGPRHSGKSEILARVGELFGENKADCGGSTIKFLIPNFSSKVPGSGFLLQSHRVCLIDEMLGLLSRTGRNLDESVDEFSTVNNILEHKKNMVYGSGKGEIKMRMRAKVLAANNPFRAKNIKDTLDFLPQPFLDRFLLIKFTKNYHDYVNSNKYVFDFEERRNINRNIFMSVFDYLQSFLSEFNRELVKDIIDKYAVQAPEELKFGDRTGSHHLPLIMDGIIKTRCLFSKDVNFKAIPQDYIVFEGFMRDYIRWWWDDNPPKGVKLLSLLNDEQKAIMEFVGDEGTSRQTLRKKLQECQIEEKYNLKYLYDCGLLGNDGNNRIFKVVNDKELVMNLEDIDLK